MNRRSFLGGALRVIAAVAGAAALVAPLDPRRVLPGIAVPVVDPTEAWTTTYLHKTWALGIGVTHELQEDDLYEMFTRMKGRLDPPDVVITSERLARKWGGVT